MQPVWREMEQLSTTGVARNIGVADLFRDRLKELYDWSTVKPTIDQVNLAHCCTIPEVRFINNIKKVHCLRYCN
jgi:glutamate--cysteine ligase regulatory subunit